jgi:hypothetical protein
VSAARADLSETTGTQLAVIAVLLLAAIGVATATTVAPSGIVLRIAPTPAASTPISTPDTHPSKR